MGGSWAPAAVMLVVEVGYAGLNVSTKLALDTGMSPFVLITYRQLVAALFLTPLAFFMERKKNRGNLTKRVLFQIFLASIFGATLNQLLYAAGLKLSSPTIGCALTNILPAITFILAVPFKMEKVRIRTAAGQAKVAGTLLCIGGSMLMTLYKGTQIHMHPSGIHWKYAEEAMSRGTGSADAGGHSVMVGAVLVMLSSVAWAVWFIVQKKISRDFPLEYTSSAIMSAMAAVECAVVGASVNRKISDWALGRNARLAASLYAGLVPSGFALILMSWCIKKRGPLFVAMFNPVLLIIVALFGWAIRDEKLYIGRVIGSVLIVVGLYTVLWGSGRELKMESSSVNAEVIKEDKGDNVITNMCDVDHGAEREQP